MDEVQRNAIAFSKLVEFMTRSGYMKSFSEKRESIESYIRESNLYEKKQPLNFDMREYDLYVRENHLDVDEITPEIMKKFEKKE